MKLGESFVIALKSLALNRLRTILTMLGIIIGVAAVIALVSAGQGAQKTISAQIDSMGSNLIMIVASRGLELESDDAEYILSRVKSISKVMPTIQTSMDVKSGADTKSVSLHGVTEDFPEIRSFRPAEGRFILSSDVDGRRKVAVIGRKVVKDVFEGRNPIGETLSVKGQPFTVVGVMQEKGNFMDMDNDNVVFIPITTMQRLLGTKYVSALYAQVGNIADTETAVAKIASAFNAKFRRSDTVRVASQKELLDTMSTVTKSFTVLLASIAGISLLVGGIGIMNIMLVSVTERTQEIGLRKAIGAKKRDVMFQFLIEAIILSGFGGFIGIVLGSAATNVLAKYGGWSASTSPSAVLLAVGFSLGVGLFFGLYPASRAASLDPIYCLRYQ